MPELFEKLSCLGGEDGQKCDGDVLLVDDDDLRKVEHIAYDRGEDHGDWDIPLASVVHEVDKSEDIRQIEVSLVHSGQKIGHQHGGEEKELHKVLVLKVFEESQAEVDKEDNGGTGAEHGDHAEALKIRALKEAPDCGSIMEEEAVVLGLVGIDAQAACQRTSRQNSWQHGAEENNRYPEEMTPLDLTHEKGDAQSRQNEYSLELEAEGQSPRDGTEITPATEGGQHGDEAEADINRVALRPLGGIDHHGGCGQSQDKG